MEGEQYRPVIAVVGVGAVGGYYAGKLIRAGYDVHLLLRSDYDAVRERGLEIRSARDGDSRLRPDQLQIYRDPHDMPRPDVVLVALKATGNDAFDGLIRPLLKEDTILLTIQNGLGNEDQLASLFGAERVIGGMAFVCINRLGPGVIHHIDHGFLKIGEYAVATPATPGTASPGSASRATPGASPRVERLAAMFRSSGVRCDVLDDLRRGRWEKLVWNVPFNGLGAVLDLSTDRLLASDAGMTLVTALMREVIATAAADGVDLPPDVVERNLANTATMGAYRSSMQMDRQQGRALEVEAILGEPLRRAEALKVPTPHLQTLYQMARLVDPAAQTV